MSEPSVPRVTGSFVALITPFDDNGDVDYGAFRTLIEWHAEHGSSAILIMGSTGEVSMLTPEERRDIITRTAAMQVTRADGRPLQLWYGCTGPSTDATIDYLRHAADAGADGAIVAAIKACFVEGNLAAISAALTTSANCTSGGHILRDSVDSTPVETWQTELTYTVAVEQL